MKGDIKMARSTEKVETRGHTASIHKATRHHPYIFVPNIKQRYRDGVISLLCNDPLVSSFLVFEPSLYPLYFEEMIFPLV